MPEVNKDFSILMRYGRPSGKTIRSLLNAMIIASHGDNVVYVVEDQSTARIIFSRAIDIARVVFGDHFLRVSITQRKITFGKKSWILFFPHDLNKCDLRDVERLRGLKYSVVVD